MQQEGQAKNGMQNGVESEDEASKQKQQHGKSCARVCDDTLKDEGDELCTQLLKETNTDSITSSNRDEVPSPAVAADEV